jgi:uncharacterized membrane protein YjjB (DUF3815 family)
MIIQTLSAFFATIFFSIIFHIPKTQVLFCGINGGLGWFIYLSIYHFTTSPVVASFAGALTVSFISQWFARIRKVPVTLFLILGIIPIVPGAGMYQTMFAMLSQDFAQMDYYGAQTLQIAGVIAIAIVINSSIPKLFRYKYKH